jgi:hypothetical protein
MLVVPDIYVMEAPVLFLLLVPAVVYATILMRIA